MACPQEKVTMESNASTTQIVRKIANSAATAGNLKIYLSNTSNFLTANTITTTLSVKPEESVTVYADRYLLPDV